MLTIHGNSTGLKPGEIKKLENIYRRKVPPQMLITPELGRYLTEISRQIDRQVGLVIDRLGTVQYVIVGDNMQLTIPALDAFSLGQRRLRGLRLIHTHLKEEPLTNDDMTDLALLRLDMMVAIGVRPDGLPGVIHTAHLLPKNPGGQTWALIPPRPFHQLDMDFERFVDSLEEEMLRVQGETFDVKDPREKAMLISVMPKRTSKIDQKEMVDELTELATSADLIVVETIMQRPDKLNPKTLMGEGKLREIVISALQMGVGLLIFDQELSPSQLRSITELAEIKVIDRSQLILDIFARRAHSRDGKVQVELAQLKYRLPMLSGKGVDLSRLMGGVGGRGPGETKLETDRRRLRDRISQLERMLKELSNARGTRKSRRADAGIPIISIIGYTNAGKSTLLNALTQSTTFVENKLFATLDTASRRLRFPKDRDVIITDTVGFIRDLPKPLFAAFKATLEELEDADILLHVVDISSPTYEKQMQSVEKVLADLKIEDKARLIVFNKVDLIPEEEARSICIRHDALAISALNRKSFKPLLEELERRLWPDEIVDLVEESVDEG